MIGGQGGRLGRIGRRTRLVVLASVLASGLALGLGSGLGGCSSNPRDGYSSMSSFDTSVRTVSVPILENDTFHPSIALDLTDALVKEIQRRTPYNVTGEVRADTILSGRIRRVELDQLAKSKLTGLSEEVIVTVTIDFEWTDLRTGRTLVARESYAGQGVFNPSRPVGEPVELGTLAVVQQLARDVVSEMRSAW